MSPSPPETEVEPSRAERERLDREHKEKEAKEQATLPYKWTQTISEAEVTIPVPAEIRGKDLEVILTKTKIRVGLKGKDPIIDVCTNVPLHTVHILY